MEVRNAKPGPGLPILPTLPSEFSLSCHLPPDGDINATSTLDDHAEQAPLPIEFFMSGK